MKLLNFFVLLLLFSAQPCRAQANAEVEKQEAQKQRIREIEGYISRQDDGIAETKKKLQNQELSPVEAADKIQWYTSEKQRYADQIDEIRRRLPPQPDLAKRQKELLESYKRATKAVNDAATAKIESLKAAQSELKANIDAARVAFLKAKESKIDEIDRAMKTVEEKRKMAEAVLLLHQTNCDHIKAMRRGERVDPTEHNRIIRESKEAISAATSRLAEYQAARLRVSAQRFESSDNYLKAQNRLLEFPRSIGKVEAWRSEQLAKLSRQYASQERSIGQ